MVPSPRPRASYSLTGVTPASTVLVYRNGDPFYSGRKFVIHHRHVRTFEALIAQLNEGVEVPFGVRTLYTPQEGHRIRNLSEIKQGGKYVAAGRERFKKLDKIRVPSRWQLISNKPRNINVFTNGDMLIPPIKFIIPRFTLKNWNCVLALINEKIFPRSGGVHRLYTLDGHAVRNSDGLEDNHYYVAAGKEKFKSLPYWRSSRVSPEVQRLCPDKSDLLVFKVPPDSSLFLWTQTNMATPLILGFISLKCFSPCQCFFVFVFKY
uniref:Doublecortin domain containing 2C n=1 Tax=Gopherus evgoodei TaxID=1825980 RepID=A0A8C4WB06_9SAUR